MRFKVYRNSLKKTYVENKKMNECAIRCNSATFEVIEEVLDLTILRHREDYYLKMYSDNPNIINRSKSAFSNKGIVWTEQERISISRSLKGIPHKKRKLNDCLL